MVKVVCLAVVYVEGDFSQIQSHMLFSAWDFLPTNMLYVILGIKVLLISRMLLHTDTDIE